MSRRFANPVVKMFKILAIINFSYIQSIYALAFVNENNIQNNS